VATILFREHRHADNYSQDYEKKAQDLDHEIEEEGRDNHDHDHFHDDLDEEDHDHSALVHSDEEEHSHHHSHSHGHHHGHNHGHDDDGNHEEGIVALTDEQIKGLGLQTQTAGKGEMLLTLSTRGKVSIDPDRLAHVIPKVSGIAIEARKNIGSYVRQGEIIAILESQDIADLKAAYLAAISKEKLASSILQREKLLYQRGVSAGEDFFTAQNASEEARINLQLAIHKLRAFGISEEEIRSLANNSNNNLRIYPIYAPIDGMVIMRHITQGEHIENTATIYEIADFSRVWVEAGIYPKDLHRLHDGQIVEITNPETNHLAKARLIYISPIVADDTITAKAIALLDNPHGLWRPGSFVKVSIATDQISCPLLICKEAIQKIDGKDCAFVATDKGFEKRELQLGRSDRDNVEVVSGLLPGEKYVANRSFLLKAEMNKELADHEH
jgi:cobalt-zinc-cadmium efflux system membrane fusion protein